MLFWLKQLRKQKFFSKTFLETRFFRTEKLDLLQNFEQFYSLLSDNVNL